MQMIELDDRRRTSFGRLGHKEHTRYIVEEKDDGTMVLIPALVVPATLSAERIESIRKGVEQSHAGKVRPARDVLRELGIDPDDDSEDEA